MKKSSCCLHCVLISTAILAVACKDARADVDLVALAVWYGNPWKTYYPGDNLTLNPLVENRGDEASDSYTVMFYVSTQQSRTGAAPNVDYYLGSVTRGPVPSGEEDRFWSHLTLPQDLPENFYYATTVVVYSGDSNPNNNRWYTDNRMTVIIPRPNFSVQSVEALENSCRPGEEIHLNVAIKNIGQLAGGGTISYFASTDGTFASSRLSIGSDTISLPAGQERTAMTTCKIPSDAPSGTYFILAVVTCSADVDLTNNQRTWGNLWVGPYPDLSVQRVEAGAGPFAPGDALTVDALIQNVGDRRSGNYTVHFYLSADATMTSQDQNIGSIDGSALASGEQRSAKATCRLPAYLPAGNCYIGVIVTGGDDTRVGNNTGSAKTPVTLIHPPGYVCGRVTYQDTSAWVHPVRYARVKIYNADSDNDPLNDRLLKETATDGDGNFGAVLVRDAASGPQIYVKVFTEGVSGAYPGTTSAICTVKDDVLKSLYSLKSAPCPYPAETSTTVNMLSPRTAGEFMVFDSIVEGFHKTKEVLDSELPGISAYWPSSNGGTYYSPGQGIWVARYDRGDRDVILHEYGHYVADSHGFALGSVGLNPFHYWNMDLRFYPHGRTNDEARNLAFREAWATLFSVAIQYGDTGYPYAGDAGYQDVEEVAWQVIMLNLETDTYASRTPGEYFENMNCGALWDIFDDQNDTRNFRDTLSDQTLSKIWTTARDYKPKDILDFWNSWFEQYDYRKEMLAIFGNHQMNFKYTKASPTVATFESGQLDGFAWTTTGDALWSVVSDVSHQGTYSARAGGIQAGQSSTLEITLTCEVGRVGFWYRLSTELGGDMLNFYIDGVRQNNWSGEKDWQWAEFMVQDGAHKFTWKYTKDGSVTRGADTVWLDDIEFPVW